MSPDCAVLGCAAGRRTTRDRRQRMALFFRAQPRMFFLFLLGRGGSEKNCAGFCRDLREFSRAVAWGRLAGVAAAGWLAGETGVRSIAPPRPRRGCSSPVCQGFRALRAVTLTVELHSLPIGRVRRMSTTPRPSADRVRVLTVRLHSVSSSVGAGMSTPGTGMRFARAPMLTVGIHSAASGSWRWISTSWPAHLVDPLRASPLEYTGSGVGLSRGYPRRDMHAAWLPLRTHR